MKSQAVAHASRSSVPSTRPQTLKQYGSPSTAVPRIPLIMCSSDCKHTCEMLAW